MSTIKIARCIVSAIAIICAAYLAFHGKEGWGWMIVVAILAIPGVA